jgi:hypothetical protein
MVGKKDPRGEEKPLSRPHRIEAACQTREVCFDQIFPLWQQPHGEKEEAIARDGGDGTSELGYGSQVGFFKLTSRRPKNGVCAT